MTTSTARADLALVRAALTGGILIRGDRNGSLRSTSLETQRNVRPFAGAVRRDLLAILRWYK